MCNSTFVGIGVDKFAETNIDNLSFCVSDLKFVARLFSIFNLCNKSHYLFNEEATYSNIIEVLNSLTYFNENIVIFISTHGRMVDFKSRLLCYDTTLNSTTDSSISIDNIINIVKDYRSKNIKLFIDACNITFNNIVLPHNLEIYYPQKNITHEDTTLNRSVFVNKLMYEYSCKSKFNFNCSKKSIRYQRIRQQTANHFIRNGNFLCVTGKLGSGKSYFLREIIKNEADTYYISIPNMNNISLDIILNLMTQEVTKQKNINFDIDPKRYLLFFDSLYPYSLFIFDHAEHLSRKVMYNLVVFLKKFKSQVIVSSTDKLSYLHDNETMIFPTLSQVEIKEILDSLNMPNYMSLPEIMKCKNYIEILQCIQVENKTNLKVNQVVINSIVSTGGYVNEELFCQYFNIDKKEHEALKKSGLVVKHNNFYYPHDSLYEQVTDEDITNLSNIACSYWKEESRSKSITSIYQYILVLNYFSPTSDYSDEKNFIEIIKALSGRSNMHFLLSLYNYLETQKLSENLAYCLCNALIDISEFKLAKNIININSNNSPLLNSTFVECLWWEGDFESVIIKTNEYLQHTSCLKAKYHLLCSRGIAYFFLGEWELAKRELEYVITNKKYSNEKSLFLSFCVIATIDGLRGTCFSKAIENFIKSIDIAKSNNKYSWIAIAYGNIGEIFWKAGYAEFAIKILSIADEISYLNGNDALNLEINRNLLHAYHCSNKASKIKAYLLKLEKIYNETSENYVKMQLVNSLITCYILNKENNFNSLISSSYSLTKNSMEYKIYTYANIALTYILKNDLKKAIQKMQQALTLCRHGKNWLAMKQILRDWDELAKKSNHSFLSSKQVFQKWCQILEIKLSQQLHHLLHLREYLERSYTS